jgi:hypothetical protein
VLVLLIAVLIGAFLSLGALVFVVCALIPPTRRFALSAALWCAVWGPCTAGWMMLAGIGIVANAFMAWDGDSGSFHAPKLIATFGWAYLMMAILTTALVATGTAWLHQKIVRRFTFALFRLYAAAVAAGIGGVAGLILACWRQWAGTPPYDVFGWIAGILILAVGFGYMAYKHARHLRGKAPTNFTWISPEEYTGAGQT